MRTDRHDEANSHFRNFAKVTKKDRRNCITTRFKTRSACHVQGDSNMTGTICV